jgi:hypothetical protein
MLRKHDLIVTRAGRGLSVTYKQQLKPKRRTGIPIRTMAEAARLRASGRRPPKTATTHKRNRHGANAKPTA